MLVAGTYTSRVFEFKIVPVVDIMAAVPVFQRVNGWRESVK